jgi:hypothetical protein
VNKRTTDRLAVQVVGALSGVAMDDPKLENDDVSDGEFVFYDLVGDFVEFFQSKEPYEVEFIDPLFTVYKSKKTKRVIGGQLCHLHSVVLQILECAPNFRVEIRDNEISLNALFTACKWTQTGHLSEAMVDVFNEVCEVTRALDGKVQIPALV